MRELISTLKNKKAQAGNELSNILPQIFAREEKATTTSTRNTYTFEGRNSSVDKMPDS